MNITIDFFKSNLVKVQNFSLNWQLSFSGPNFPKKGISCLNRRIHQWILHILISLGAKFQPKLTILSFWTKFTQKGHFQLKIEKLNITLQFCILELTQVPKLAILIFWTNFAQKENFESKTEKLHFCKPPWSLLTKLNFSTQGADRHNSIMSLFLLVPGAQWHYGLGLFQNKKNKKKTEKNWKKTPWAAMTQIIITLQITYTCN